MHPRASVIIITWNQHLLLKQCLESLSKHVNHNQCELIVIDNGSSKECSTLVSSIVPHARVVRNQKNTGVASARNQGFALANSSVIVFLDDDTFCTTDFVESGLQFLEENSNVGILAPALLYPEGEVQPSARPFPSVRRIIGRAFPFFRKSGEEYLRSYTHATAPVEVDWVMGACQFIRRSVVDGIGGLDEGYFFGYEDVDYCFRAKEKWKIVYHPQIRVYHHYQRKSASLLGLRFMFSHIKSIVRFFGKNGLRW